MALYHAKAAALKGRVLDAHFSAAQLDLIKDMMHGCVQLRKNADIDSFLAAMLPDYVRLVKGDTIVGKYGPYTPLKVVDIPLAELFS